MRFKWPQEAQDAFQALKVFLTELPTLTVQIPGETLLLFLTSSNEAVGLVLLGEWDNQQMPIYFFNRALKDSELQYLLATTEILPGASNLGHHRPAKQVLSKIEYSGRLTY